MPKKSTPAGKPVSKGLVPSRQIHPQEIRVLVVDDDDRACATTVERLRRDEFQVTLADGIASAAESLRRSPVDVVVLDMDMPNPEGDAAEAGLVLLRALSQFNPKPRAVVFTPGGSQQYKPAVRQTWRVWLPYEASRPPQLDVVRCTRVEPRPSDTSRGERWLREVLDRRNQLDRPRSIIGQPWDAPPHGRSGWDGSLMLKLRLDQRPRSLNIAKPDPGRLLLVRGLLVLALAPSLMVAVCGVRNAQAEQARAQATTAAYRRLAWPMSEDDVETLFGHAGRAVDGKLMRKATVEISPLAPASRGRRVAFRRPGRCAGGDSGHSTIAAGSSSAFSIGGCAIRRQASSQKRKRRANHRCESVLPTYPIKWTNLAARAPEHVRSPAGCA